MISATIDGSTFTGATALDVIAEITSGDGFTMAAGDNLPDYLADQARRVLRLPVWRAPAGLPPEARALHILRSLQTHGAIELSESES